MRVSACQLGLCPGTSWAAATVCSHFNTRSAAAPSNRLYVGNLSWATGNDELMGAFASFGSTEARVIQDRETNRSKVRRGAVKFSANSGHTPLRVAPGLRLRHVC